MARAQKPKSSKSNVVPMAPETGGNVVVEDPEPETPFDQAETPKPPAPSPPEPPPVRKGLTFWQRVGAIPKSDWGSRAFIYVYCLEPICDLRQGGEKKYLVRLQSPVEDENFLMADYGSGKYRLQLVHRKPAADKSDAVDSVEVEIYNPKYPPKIPRSVWMNDRRNDRWAALLPKEEPPQPPTPLGAVSDAFKTFTEIQKDIREQITPPPAPPPPPPTDRVAEFRGMLQAAKEMMPAPAPATDNKVLDTVVQLMMKQLDASQQETKELRQEMRDLMKERAAKPEGEGLEAWIDKLDKLTPKLQSLLGLGGEKLADVVHGRKRGFWEELALKSIEQFSPGVNSLMTAGAQFLLMPQQGLGAPPRQAALPAPANGAQQPAAVDPLQPLKIKVGNFLGANLAALEKYFEGFVKGVPSELDPDSKMNGEDLAIWINTGNPQILQDVRSLGSANIIAMFQAAPPLWNGLLSTANPKNDPEIGKSNEAKFRQFLDQVLAFSPEEEPEKEEEGPVEIPE